MFREIGVNYFPTEAQKLSLNSTERPEGAILPAFLCPK